MPWYGTKFKKWTQTERRTVIYNQDELPNLCHLRPKNPIFDLSLFTAYSCPNYPDTATIAVYAFLFQFQLKTHFSQQFSSYTARRKQSLAVVQKKTPFFFVISASVCMCSRDRRTSLPFKSKVNVWVVASRLAHHSGFSVSHIMLCVCVSVLDRCCLWGWWG